METKNDLENVQYNEGGKIVVCSNLLLNIPFSSCIFGYWVAKFMLF
jgi:hypothetical protein